MGPKTDLSVDSRRLPVILGLVPAVCGALAIVGWITHVLALVEIVPGMVPMQFNTALGLIIAGISVIHPGRAYRVAFGGGVVVTALGAITLLEFASGLNLGLDQAFFHPWTVVQTAHPGRMASATAFGFVVAGISLAGGPFRRSSFAIGGLMLSSCSFAALVGNFVAGQMPYRPEEAERMAVNTIFSFLFLGIALLSRAWQVVRLNKRIWTGVVAGCAMAVLSFLLWQDLVRANAKSEVARADAVALSRAHLAAASLQQTANALLRFHRRWSSARNSRVLRPDLEAYFRDFPEITAIGWVEPSGRPIELYARESGSAAGSAVNDMKLAQQLVTVVGDRLPSAGLVSGLLPHGPDQQDLVIGLESSAGAPVFLTLIDSAVALRPGVSQQTWLTHVLAGTVQVAYLGDSKDSARRAAAHYDIAVLDQIWTLAVSPRDMPDQSHLADLILLAGLLISCFISVSVYLWRTGQERLGQIGLLNAVLEDRVAERTRDFEEANLTLEGSIDEERIISAKLLERERQLFATFRAGKIGTWTHDLVTGTLQREGHLNELFGLKGEETTLPFDQHATSIHPDDRQIGPDAEKAAIDGQNREFEAEVRRIWPDGSIHWYSILGRVVRDENGEAIQTTGVTADITKRKEAELAVVESERRLRQLADAMPQIVWTAGTSGEADYRNRKWYDYTGQIAGNRKITDEGRSVIHDDDLTECLAAWKLSLASGEDYEAEYRIRRSDGAYRWHLARAVAVRNVEGEIVHWFGTSTDIEEYKRSEAEVRRLNESLEVTVQQRTAELRESEERFRTLVESVNDYSITMLDAQGCVATWTLAAERLKGYQASEIVGKHISRFFTPEDIERGHPEEILRLAATHGGLSEEGVRVRKDGSRFWADDSITAVYDDAGLVRGFSTVTHDITERKLAEYELTAARERAEEASRAKSNFLAAMSHEIRTPMNAILGMAEMLWESELDPVQREYVEIFRRAGGDLMTLINDLLDLSKIEARRLELERLDFDLEEPLDQAMELIAPKARAKNITLLCRLTPGTDTDLIGDPNRLRQILINLLGNAVKFTGSGEIVLMVENSDRPGRIRFSVRDTGIGIPADKLESIFQNFSQADSSTTRKYGGTGLGLGISRSLVEQMGGNLTVESVEGKGSTFSFTVQFEAAPERQKQVSRIEDLCGQRALIIDDNAINRLIQGEALASWGMESDEFAFPEEALEAMNRADGHDYAVVIVDSRMPQMDGFETARRLRELRPGLPIIMLTSDAQPGDAARRLDTGIAGYGVKPVKRTELLRLVCQALRGTSSRDGDALAQPNGPFASEAEILQGNGLSILIAEDSSNNRKLVEAYLKASPHRLTFVEDGKAAVDRFKPGDFDLVLMDIQMPVMDGLEATRSIRAFEGTRGLGTTPIVALTANAGAQDVERCHAAGCTAHLSKPISKRNLLAAIAEFGRERPLAAPLEPIEIDIPEGLEELAADYLESCKLEYAEMMTLLASSDFARVQAVAHNMKGEGESYGFPGITEIGAILERSAKQSDPQAVAASLHRLGDYLGRIQLPVAMDHA